MKTKVLLSLCLVVAMIAVGCQNDPGPVQPYELYPTSTSQIILPAEAQLESAIFYIYVHAPNAYAVNIHRVTEPWDEMTVTWNNFGGAYDPGVVASFMADEIAWRSADVTPLVQGWLDGQYPNFGLLLDQQERSFPRADYFAREFGYKQPMLEICFMMPDGRVCEQTIAIGDTYIWEASPDANNGYKDLLYTGWADENDGEKQSLIQFEVEQQIIIGGCVHTKGYWDNWDGLAQRPDIVSRHLPIWMGLPGGSESFQVFDVYMASDVLGMDLDTPKNGMIRMMAQLLCAKLNLSTGADETEIIEVVKEADIFLADHNYMEWYGFDDATQKKILDWLVALSQWNAGEFGPGRCIDYYTD